MRRTLCAEREEMERMSSRAGADPGFLKGGGGGQI